MKTAIEFAGRVVNTAEGERQICRAGSSTLLKASGKSAGRDRQDCCRRAASLPGGIVKTAEGERQVCRAGSSTLLKASGKSARRGRQDC
jgi:uncharacterized protein (DUF362 family)